MQPCICRRVFAGVRREADGAALVSEEHRIEPILMDVADTKSVAAAERTVRERLDGHGLQGLVRNTYFMSDMRVHIQAAQLECGSISRRVHE